MSTQNPNTRDLYLLDAEGYFGLNFFKGAAGIWFRLCLVIGVAVFWVMGCSL